MICPVPIPRCATTLPRLSVLHPRRGCGSVVRRTALPATTPRLACRRNGGPSPGTSPSGAAPSASGMRSGRRRPKPATSFASDTTGGTLPDQPLKPTIPTSITTHLRVPLSPTHRLVHAHVRVGKHCTSRVQRRVHEGAPGQFPACSHVPGAGSLPQRVLRLAAASALGAGAAGRCAQGPDKGDLERERQNLRRPADPRGAVGGGLAGEPQAGGAPDAGVRHRGRGRAGASRRARRRGTRRPGPHRTWSSGTSQPRDPTGCGWPTSRTCPPGRAGCTSPWCSTRGAGGSSAGRWRRT